MNFQLSKKNKCRPNSVFNFQYHMVHHKKNIVYVFVRVSVRACVTFSTVIRNYSAQDIYHSSLGTDVAHLHAQS